MKPERRIYEILLGKYGLASEECFFVDDSRDNVAAARELGMRGVVFESAEELERAWTAAKLSSLES